MKGTISNSQFPENFQVTDLKWQEFASVNIDTSLKIVNCELKIYTKA